MSAINRFGNALIYRFTQLPVHAFTSKEVSNQLAEHCHRPLASQELSTMGFVAPLGVDGVYVEPVALGCVLVTACKSERLLPGKVVKQEVMRRIAKIESDQCRKVYSKERNQIKDDVVISLIPRAFVTSSTISALISFPYIVVEASSPKKAEELLSLLREALGSLPVRPVTAKISPIASMTDWVLNDHHLHNSFRLGEAFQSRATSQESSTLSGKNVDLSEDDIRDMLSNGRQINQLELTYLQHGTGDTRFTLTETLGLKGIRWPEDFDERLSNDVGEDPDHVTVARASLLLINSTLQPLISELLHALGGEEFFTDLGEPQSGIAPTDEEDLV